MKILIPVLLFFIAISAILSALMLLPGEEPDPQAQASWPAVERALHQQRPRDALALVETLLSQAVAAEDQAHIIKALVYAAQIEGSIEGDRPEEAILRLEARRTDAPALAQPLIDAVLARWYWRYFQQHRWRISQRSATTTDSGGDVTTWDLRRLLTEIDQRYTAALADPAIKDIPVDTITPLLTEGEHSPTDILRPTLFDIVAHEALAFYQAGEQGVMMAEDHFTLAADGPIFDPMEDFLAWQVPENPGRLRQAVLLLQDLLNTHHQSERHDALLDAELVRLQLGSNQAQGEQRTARYRAALERFIADHSDHPLAADALWLLARSWHDDDDPAQAHTLASRGAQAFPDSRGGRRCRQLLAEITMPHLAVHTESLWNEGGAVISVDHRNLDRIHLRVVSCNLDNMITNPNSLTRIARRHWWGPEHLAELLRLRPTKTWSAALPPTEDFRQRSTELPLPDDLAPGTYLLLASGREDFPITDNQISAAIVFVSDIALVMRHQSQTGSQDPTDGLVVDARSGAPISGADIQVWSQHWRGRQHQVEQVAQLTSDEDGRFVYEQQADHRRLIFAARHQGHEVALLNTMHLGRSRPQSVHHSVTLFTDRAIYRPGQTISFKGILARHDQATNDYRVLPRQMVTIILRDHNRREIARLDTQSNDYGAISGHFTAPDGTVTGPMTLRIDQGGWLHHGGNIRVEEYKRPRFQVSLDDPQETVRLDEEVTVRGQASAYTGAAVDHATVRWRVERSPRFPAWMWWSHSLYGQGSQQMAHGSTQTDADGRYAITFTARPDASIPASSQASFTYRIAVDITDANGETRSTSRRITVGYQAFTASVSSPDWLQEGQAIALNLHTRSLDGVGLARPVHISVHALEQPDETRRQAPSQHRHFSWQWRQFVREQGRPPVDPSKPQSWPLGEVIWSDEVETDADGQARVDVRLPAGIYKAVVRAEDDDGQEILGEHLLRVVNPAAPRYPIPEAWHLAAPTWSVEPGQDFVALWASGYEHARVYIEVEHRGQILQAYWSDPAHNQTLIRQPVSEAMRGGFTLRCTFVRDSRVYTQQRSVQVPWSDRRLDLRWERMVSKLGPGDEETWTAVIRNHHGEAAIAEMVATLYDASLDQFLPHSWPGLGGFYHDRSHRQIYSLDGRISLPHSHNINWHRSSVAIPDYRSFLPFILHPARVGIRHARGRLQRAEGSFGLAADGVASDHDAAPPAPAAAMDQLDKPVSEMETEDPIGDASPTDPDLDTITARRNLAETAFFFPHLVSDPDGTVRISFTMPETLTTWRFMGFAHDRQLRSGLLTGEAVSAKELMVQPNPPRFLREGDEVLFSATVTNMGEIARQGQVRLTIADLHSGDSRDEAVGNDRPELPFSVAPGRSQAVTWRLRIPDDQGFLTYRVVGGDQTLSDGEEGHLPVLPRRLLVTESLPLPIRGEGQRTFTLDKLLASADSKTLRHQNLSVQMVSQPAWYAVMALPYLMEFPYECSEQIFNRLYANSLGHHIVNSRPRIREVFAAWRGTPALDSPLFKNQDLKSLMIEETPWLRQAQDESQARRQVGILFEDHRLAEEIRRTQIRLADRQHPDGSWPWFPGGRGNEFITLYIVSGYGRLRQMGVENLDLAPAQRALRILDQWAVERHQRIRHDQRLEDHILNPLDALLLYGRSFFLADQAPTGDTASAYAYFLERGRQTWNQTRHRQSQAHLALALQRWDDARHARIIMESIRQRAVEDEEMGLFWRDSERHWSWYRAPIETQALMIEAFAEIMDDAETVEAAQVWLLKQKQTQHWRSTKATADAVYALLGRGVDLLSSSDLVAVQVGETTITPRQVEAGTGYYEHRFSSNEITPEMGTVTLTKTDPGVAWGSLHWQYLEDIEKITPHEATPLRLRKTLWRRVNTPAGPMLEAIDGPLSIGDEVVSRITLTTDRDLEYVHLKDQRGSGTEPVDVLSTYRWQDGLGYYQSTRDTASHFFISYLPKGSYVFEYSVRVQLAGRYHSGIATIQCMYAPEFNAHSNSVIMEVQAAPPRE